MIYVIFIIPFMILLIGYLMYKYPHKKINFLVGYRTFSSMKNKEMWDFAHEYCGKVWMILGLMMIIFSSILYFLVWLKVIAFTENIVSGIVLGEVGMLLLSIFIVENKLRKNINNLN